MAVRQLSKFTRALVASMMSMVLVATPLAASVAPVATGAVAGVPVGDPDPDTFSAEAHAQALLQLGFQEQPCQSGEARAERDTSGTMWFLGGCLLGFIGLGAAYIYEPSPPASALVGQDDQFVAQYTDCYVDRAQDIQKKQALYGCLAGGAAYVLFYVLAIGATVASTAAAP